MPSNLENAYFSAVIVSNGLTSLKHPKRADAAILKEGLAKAISNPAFLQDKDFPTIWKYRTYLTGLKLEGDMGEAINKHVGILQGITL